MERNQSIHKCRHKMLTPLQRDATRVDWKAVEGGPIQTGEGLEMCQSAFLIKNLGIALQGEGRIEDAGTTAGGFLAGSGMGCGIGAEEEAMVATGGRLVARHAGGTRHPDHLHAHRIPPRA